MITREIRDKRFKLLLIGRELKQRAIFAKDIEKAVEFRMQHEAVYRHWLFYDGLIKAFDKIGGLV